MAASMPQTPIPTAAPANNKRILLGALLGGVVWNAWSFLINIAVLGKLYAEAQNAGLFLKEPRYGFFVPAWILMLFALSFLLARLYVNVRGHSGPGPWTALRLGLVVGLFAALPMNFATATWSPLSRQLPLWWMIDMWVGCTLAALVAGWVYKDPA